jgi:excisionase family DNA binding protein
MSDLDLAASLAIFSAKQSGSGEVSPDHLLIGCLRAISRFGIAKLGAWSLDLETLGVDWIRQPEGVAPKVGYSLASVDLLDRAARIAKSSGESRVGVRHLLAAFASEETGLMGELKRAYGITSGSWRAAVADLGGEEAGREKAERALSAHVGAREYLTTEEAADTLGVHVQTMRAYIRNERLPAFRLAGERAIRILRSDLAKVLEPLVGEKKEE